MKPYYYRIEIYFDGTNFTTWKFVEVDSESNAKLFQWVKSTQQEIDWFHCAKISGELYNSNKCDVTVDEDFNFIRFNDHP